MNLSAYILASIPVLLGLGVILQSGLNRKIAAVYSFPIATLMNSFVLMTTSFIVYFLSRRLVNGQMSLNMTELLKDFRWWYVIPGLCGYAIITGLPFSINRIGAMKTFLLFLVTQIILSVIWDAYVESREVLTMQIVGVSLSLIGIVIFICAK